MYNAGEGIEIRTKEDYKEFIDERDFILEQYENEIFSFDEYSFEAIELIACRYYGHIPTMPKFTNKL